MVKKKTTAKKARSSKSSKSSLIRDLLDADPGIKPAEAIRVLGLVGVDIDSNIFGVVRLNWRRKQTSARSEEATEAADRLKASKRREEGMTLDEIVEEVDSRIQAEEELKQAVVDQWAEDERERERREIEEHRRLEEEEVKQASERWEELDRLAREWAELVYKRTIKNHAHKVGTLPPAIRLKRNREKDGDLK